MSNQGAGNGFRNVVVTGAAGGMGTQALRLLAKREVNVVCVDINEEGVKQAVEGLGKTPGEFIAVCGDMRDAKDAEAAIGLAVERWGRLDGLFNIAGTAGALQFMAEATVEDYEYTMDTNIRTVFLGMKFALPHLLAGGGGTIVSTGSFLSVRGVPACGAYAASKHAIVGLTKTLALEVAQQKVRANVVCPGSMDTQMITEIYPKISPDLAEAEAAITSQIPSQRLARPEELASTGVWLLLDAPEHLTGQTIVVDGGQSAG